MNIHIAHRRFFHSTRSRTELPSAFFSPWFGLSTFAMTWQRNLRKISYVELWDCGLQIVGSWRPCGGVAFQITWGIFIWSEEAFLIRMIPPPLYYNIERGTLLSYLFIIAKKRVHFKFPHCMEYNRPGVSPQRLAICDLTKNYFILATYISMIQMCVLVVY